MTGTIQALEDIESEFCTLYGVDSRPAGLAWAKIVLDMVERILTEPALIDAITPADLEGLTAENFHTARHAAEIALHLKKYM